MVQRGGRRTQRNGATLVESAFVISAFIMLLFGLYEYGRFLMLKNVIDQAARTGARLAVVNTNTMSTTAIQDAVDNALGGMGNQFVSYAKYTNITVNHYDSSGNNIGTDWYNARFGESVGVTITGSYTPFPSYILPAATFTVSSTAVMNSEAN
jgi:Flp pilus assembly protein TadG